MLTAVSPLSPSSFVPHEIGGYACTNCETGRSRTSNDRQLEPMLGNEKARRELPGEPVQTMIQICP